MFGFIGFSGCNSEELVTVEENNENQVDIEIYNQAKNRAEKQNTEFMNKIVNYISRSNDFENRKLVNYLMGLPPATIDSIYSSYLPYFDEIDSLQNIGIDKFIEIYGVEVYRNYIDFFGNKYIPGSVFLVVSEVRDMNPKLAAIYLEAAGRIDGGIDFSFMSRAGCYDKDRFDYCIGQLAYAYGDGVAEEVAFYVTSELAVYMGELEIGAAIDLVGEGLDLHGAISAVHDFNNCMR